VHLILCGCHINVHVIVILIEPTTNQINVKIYWNFVQYVLEIYWKFVTLELQNPLGGLECGLNVYSGELHGGRYLHPSRPSTEL